MLRNQSECVYMCMCVHVRVCVRECVLLQNKAKTGGTEEGRVRVEEGPISYDVTLGRNHLARGLGFVSPAFQNKPSSSLQCQCQEGTQSLAFYLTGTTFLLQLLQSSPPSTS